MQTRPMLLSRKRYLGAGLLATIALVLSLAGCGAGAAPAPTTDVVPADADPEKALRVRADEAHAALNASDWKQYYQYQSPRLRRPRWPYGLELVQPCSRDKFAVAMEKAVTEVRGTSGLGVDEPVRWGTASVEAEGNEGLVFVDITLNGELVDYTADDAGIRWVLIDGQWWREDPDWRDGCPGLASVAEEGEGEQTPTPGPPAE